MGIYFDKFNAVKIAKASKQAEASVLAEQLNDLSNQLGAINAEIGLQESISLGLMEIIKQEEPELLPAAEVIK